MKITSDLTNLTTAILILTVQMFIEWTLWFLHICSRKLATTPTFFFNGKICQVTPRLKVHFRNI
jgi:hypothetical protein